METPAGKECSFFYGDYYRGRNHEECRLLMAASPPENWSPDLCSTCPVPEIQLANACPNLILEGKLERPFPFFKKKVKLSAYCSKTLKTVTEPKIGCGECHPLPPIFTGVLDDPDSSV